jgi:U6 snRNA-associated Sm-like protein LSm1
MAENLSAAASLVEELDKRLLVVLRDGRHYIGVLRSFDQFSNIVLEDTVERVVVDRAYADLPLGLYLVRGENVVLMGELAGAERAAPPLEGHTLVSSAEMHRLVQAEKESQAIKGQMSGRFDFLEGE